MKEIWFFIAGAVLGKAITDNIPSLHWKDLLRYAANFIKYAQVGLTIGLLVLLYKFKLLPKQLEQVLALMLGMIVLGLAFTQALKADSNKVLTS